MDVWNLIGIIMIMSLIITVIMLIKPATWCNSPVGTGQFNFAGYWVHPLADNLRNLITCSRLSSRRKNCNKYPWVMLLHNNRHMTLHIITAKSPHRAKSSPTFFPEKKNLFTCNKITFASLSCAIG